MTEALVYEATRHWFLERGFRAIAGQPPNGCDNIPTVEIKDPRVLARGSKGALKPDLIVASVKSLLVIECKAKYSRRDAEKLRSVADDVARQQSLYSELVQRRLLRHQGVGTCSACFEEFRAKLGFCLAYCGRPVEDAVLFSLALSADGSAARLVYPLSDRYRPCVT
jgi:hypothetical protein